MNHGEMHRKLSMLSSEDRRRARGAILADARAAGLRGFGGLCGAVAVAIRRVLFGPTAELAGALNEAFLDAGRPIGHAAVVDADGRYWDSDGRPKSFDEVEAWGMLDPDDPDYEADANERGFAWTEEAAYEAILVVFDSDRECLDHFGHDVQVPLMERLLSASARRWARGELDSPGRSAGI